MASRHETQTRRMNEATTIQKTQSPIHHKTDHQSHQKKQRRTSRESGGVDGALSLNTSSSSIMAEYYGGGGSRVTRTAGITGLLTVSEQGQQPQQPQQAHPPRSPGTSVSAGSQRSHQKQSPAAVAGSPRAGHSHKTKKHEHLPIKATASTSTPGSTEGEYMRLTSVQHQLETNVATNYLQSFFYCLIQTYLTALSMPTKKPLPGDDVLNALFERLIVSHTSKLAAIMGVSDQRCRDWLYTC